MPRQHPRRHTPGVTLSEQIELAAVLQCPRCAEGSLALQRAGWNVQDVQLFELNEAFAAVGIASMDDLGVSDDIVNVNGGAISLGHPIGMSGTRVALTLAHELRRRGGGTGAAALCGGGGQGDALLIRSL